CLMFQGFPQFCVALLDLLEQSHVLDGDDRLISEGLEKGDLLFRERLDHGTTNDYNADRLVLPHKGCGENSADAKTFCSGSSNRVFFCDGEHILDVNDLALEDRAGNNPVTIEGSSRIFYADGTMMSSKPQSVILNEPNRRVIGAAYLRGTFGYRVQHRLQISRRAGDDTQDFTRRRLLL